MSSCLHVGGSGGNTFLVLGESRLHCGNSPRLRIRSPRAETCDIVFISLFWFSDLSSVEPSFQLEDLGFWDSVLRYGLPANLCLQWDSKFPSHPLAGLRPSEDSDAAHKCGIPRKGASYSPGFTYPALPAVSGWKITEESAPGGPKGVKL